MNKADMQINLVAEEGATLSSGSLRLYAQLSNTNSSFSTLHSSLSTPNSPFPIIGSIDLYAYDPVNRRAAVGIMMATEYRRQGYGLAMLQALKELAVTVYKLHTLYADIASPNIASQALFRKAGYEECGRFKEWLEYDSHFIDNIRMQLML